MALSREWTEWHLTPQGWVAGTANLDSSLRQKPTPPDRALTFRYHETMRSPFKPPEESLEEVWRSDDRAKIDELRKAHGDCPARIEV